MTDTRRKQIEDAAKETEPDDFSGNTPAFCRGAEWADANKPLTHEGVVALHAVIKSMDQGGKIQALEEQNAALIKERDRYKKELEYIANSIPGPEQLFELENKRAAMAALNATEKGE